MSRNISTVWTFASSSGNGTYETLRYDDGSMSCSCPGWCRRVQPDGTRTCKHLRLVDQGRADVEAISSHDYTAQQTKQPSVTTITTKKSYGKKQKGILGPYARKFVLQ